MSSQQTCISNHHDQFHNSCCNIQWYFSNYKVGTSQYDNNLMLAKVASQCPFVSATCIFSERGIDLVSNITMVLTLHLPNIVTIIPLKGRWDHVSVWNLFSFIDICHHKSCHGLVFLWTLSFSSCLSAYNVMSLLWLASTLTSRCGAPSNPWSQ
jgi:hypothetical protein